VTRSAGVSVSVSVSLSLSVCVCVSVSVSLSLQGLLRGESFVFAAAGGVGERFALQCSGGRFVLSEKRGVFIPSIERFKFFSKPRLCKSRAPRHRHGVKRASRSLLCWLPRAFELRVEEQALVRSLRFPEVSET
jgi:hypothetical protein